MSIEDAFEAVQVAKSMKTRPEPRRLHERRAAMSLGALLRVKRDTLGMTLDDVAEAAGCSKSHLHSLEGDKCEPGILMCAKLSVALGLSVQAMAAAAICGALQKATQPPKGGG